MSIVAVSRCFFYLVIAAITILAVVPQEQAVVTTGWDKTNHVLAFWVLLILLDNAYPSSSLWSQKIAPLFAYGIVIEGIQSALPYRYFSLLDVCANVLGLLLYLPCRKLLSERLKTWLGKLRPVDL